MTQPALWDTTFYRWQKITIATDIGHITDELVMAGKKPFHSVGIIHDVENAENRKVSIALQKTDYGRFRASVQ